MPADSLRLERFAPYRLSVLANLVSGQLARRYERRFGLSIPQWRVVAVLGRESPLSAVGLAGRTVMDKVSVSRAVAALVRDGRVARGTDREDRRRSVLRLTRAGRTVYRRIVPLARAYERELLGTLGRRDRRELDRLLSRLSERARALED